MAFRGLSERVRDYFFTQKSDIGLFFERIEREGNDRRKD